MKLLYVIALAAFAGVVSAQDAGRGSTPPGTSQDGAGAADGALKGGSIVPGETAGMPERTPAATKCYELSGTLREQCLKDAEKASAGTTAPGSLPRPDPTVRDPRLDPPPQNPR